MAERIIGMREMRLIFEVTDAWGIDREEITVPLEMEGPGAVRRLPDGKIEIVVPGEVPLEGWLSTLGDELEKMGFAPTE